ncbi:hypothetical protein IGB42_01869 [Andreprevotia sp. IGB-42]|nr:hypothetical protein IGB42_01869 [Andreprevotia sp. IGB-42]
MHCGDLLVTSHLRQQQFLHIIFGVKSSRITYQIQKKFILPQQI